MNNNTILIRYGEIFLKGNNRSYFESLLIKNIKSALNGINYDIEKVGSRIYIDNYTEEDEIKEKLKFIFGIHSYSICKKCESNEEDIIKTSLSLAKSEGSFKIICNRADKTYPQTSLEVAKNIGGIILSKYPNLIVDIHNPDWTITIDIRENKKVYIFKDIITGAGGMPVGCSGSGLLLLSGGIDSPVAGILMTKRGMKISALHFHSYPYTSNMAKEKVISLAEKISSYSYDINLYVVPLTKIQEEIHKNIPEEYMITMMRRFMMRIAEKIALKNSLSCIITGESLAQVASQTIEGITSSNSVVKYLPILRPLIGLDKSEIIEYANKFDTFETSILPYEDCCTVFLPKKPAIHPKLEKIVDLENKLNINELEDDALKNIELIYIKKNM